MEGGHGRERDTEGALMSATDLRVPAGRPSRPLDLLSGLLWVLPLLVCAAGAVALLAGSVLLAASLLALVIGVAVLPGLVRRPRLVLGALVVLTISHGGAQLSAVGVPRPFLLLLLLALVTAVLGVRQRRLPAPGSGVLRWSAVLFVLHSVPLAAAADAGDGVASVVSLGTALLTLVVVVTLAGAPGGLRTLLVTSVATAAALASLTLVHVLLLPGRTQLLGLSNQEPGDLGSATARFSGPIADPNFWGRDLLLFLLVALAGTVLHRGRSRVAFVSAAVVLTCAVLLTGSRGTFLAIAVAVVLWLVLLGARARRLLWVVPAGLVLLLAVPGVGSRLASLSDPQTAAGQDPSLLGRQQALGYGVSMFLDNPLTGVGPGGFLAAVPTYQRRAGDSSTRPIAPHNFYLEQAAETGVVGLLGWLGFLGAAAMTAGQRLASARSGERRSEHRRVALPAALLAGLTGWAVAGLFLHLADVEVLGLVVAAVAVLPQPRSSVRYPRAGRPVRRYVVIALVAVDVLTVSALLLPWRPPVYVGEFSLTVTPSSGLVPSPYLVDVGQRPEVIATLAQVLRSPTGGQRVVPGPISRRVVVDAQSSVIDVQVRAPGRTAAAAATSAAFQEGLEFSADSGAAFVLSARTGGPQMRVERPVRLLSLGLGLLLAALAVVVAARGLRRPLP